MENSWILSGNRQNAARSIERTRRVLIVCCHFSILTDKAYDVENQKNAARSG